MSDGQLDLEAMREQHRGADIGDDCPHICMTCNVYVPCPVTRILDLLDAAQRRADEAERMLGDLAELLDEVQPYVLAHIMDDHPIRTADIAGLSTLVDRRLSRARAFLAGEGVSTRDDTQ